MLTSVQVPILFNHIRSLGFGGMLGAGLAAFVRISIGAKLPPTVTPMEFACYGGLIGSATHGIIEAAVVRLALLSSSRSLKLYMQLLVLWSLRNIAGDAKTKKRIDKAIDQYYSYQVPENAEKKLDQC
jgi:hypothetical protein